MKYEVGVLQSSFRLSVFAYKFINYRLIAYDVCTLASVPTCVCVLDAYCTFQFAQEFPSSNSTKNNLVVHIISCNL